MILTKCFAYGQRTHTHTHTQLPPLHTREQQQKAIERIHRQDLRGVCVCLEGAQMERKRVHDDDALRIIYQWSHYDPELQLNMTTIMVAWQSSTVECC